VIFEQKRSLNTFMPYVILCLALLFMIGAPWLVRSPYWIHILILAYFYGLLASSWSLLAGYAGQFSFAHLAFSAIAGYTSGLLGKFFNVSPIFGIFMGVVAAGIAGLVIGYLCLRLKGPYLALFTIAFAEILRVVISAEHHITEGERGLEVIPLFDTASKVPYYYTMLATFLLILFLMYLIEKSSLGLYFRALREDETAASSLGVNIVLFKILAFTITSCFAGLAGGIYAHYTQLLTPTLITVPRMGLVIGMAVIGGLENIFAAALGAVFIELILEYLRVFGVWRLVLFGAIIVFTLRFAKNGLFAPMLARLLGRT
jgi:branched-chain amino acid transport system permease protein